MDPVSVGLFAILALGALVSGIVVVTHRSPAGSVFALIVNSVCLAGMYLVLGDAFIAAIQVIVYTGAVLVLFFFVVMLLDIRRDELLGADSRWHRVAVALMVAAMAVSVGFALYLGLGAAPRDLGGGGGLHELADMLFGRYLLAFEAVSVLLLSAMVGVVVLTKKGFTPEAAEGEEEGS